MEIEFALIPQGAQVKLVDGTEQLQITGPANDVHIVPELPFDVRIALTVGIRYTDAEAEQPIPFRWMAYSWLGGKEKLLNTGLEKWEAPGFNPYAPEGWKSLTTQSLSSSSSPPARARTSSVSRSGATQSKCAGSR